MLARWRTAAIERCGAPTEYTGVCNKPQMFAHLSGELSFGLRLVWRQTGPYRLLFLFCFVLFVLLADIYIYIYIYIDLKKCCAAAGSFFLSPQPVLLRLFIVLFVWELHCPCCAALCMSAIEKEEIELICNVCWKCSAQVALAAQSTGDSARVEVAGAQHRMRGA